MDVEIRDEVQRATPSVNGVDNIAYEHEHYYKKLSQEAKDPAPVHRVHQLHASRREQRRSDLNAPNDRQTAPMHLDFDVGRKRRSRHFAISDTNELTSPHEVNCAVHAHDGSSLDTSLGYHSNASGSRLPSTSGSRNAHTSYPGSSVSTDRSSAMSNVSVLRQTSSFSLQLSPPNSPYQNWVISGENCDIITPPSETIGNGITIYKSIGNNGGTMATTDDNPQVFKKNLAPQMSRTRSVIDKAVKKAGVPRDSQIRRIVRQLSGRRDDFRPYDVTESYGVPYMVGTVKRPKSYFDLAIMTMCCCVSPLGFVALIMSVLSDANYKAKHYEKAKKYGKVSMTLSILGIITTLVTAVTVLLLFAYPWDDIVDL